ncbi:hypothetical protein MMC26_001440 [Xylographa opegraphella]|nr:hypothetical protein [Xylographa opegraphella]
MELPLEVCLAIVVCVARRHPRPQTSLHALCLVSRLWYDAAIRELYRAPVLAGRNFQLFVRTVCPSINLHIRRSPTAPLVKVLDLSKLVHEGSNSVTGRLLGRVKETLEVFIAPQTSFSCVPAPLLTLLYPLTPLSVNALPALSKCTYLNHLDLSLISASLPVLDLLRTLASLRNLVFLALPRCSPIPSPHILPFDRDLPALPHSLRHIQFACSLHPAYMPLFHQVPPQLTALTITDAPGWYSNPVDTIIQNIGPQITNLSLQFRLPKPGFMLQDERRTFLALHTLQVSADHLFGGFFSPAHQEPDAPPLPLTDLTIHAGSGSITQAPTCDFLYDEIVKGDDDYGRPIPGILFGLRRVYISQGLGWRSTAAGKLHAQELQDLMIALEREAWQRAGVPVSEAVERDIERSCGVWEFVEGGGALGDLRGGLDGSVVLP